MYVAVLLCLELYQQKGFLKEHYCNGIEIYIGLIAFNCLKSNQQ
nr:MAG TPA: hypothetical protein [Caudoviricetes sp.]DAM73908.1 MAG TPA: hypothetical protein [Caudoviricetes sp.]